MWVELSRAALLLGSTGASCPICVAAAWLRPGCSCSCRAACTVCAHVKCVKMSQTDGETARQALPGCSEL